MSNEDSLQFDHEALADEEMTHQVRIAARHVFGGNCTFVDDDLLRLKLAAERYVAIKKGNTESILQSWLKSFKRLFTA